MWETIIEYLKDPFLVVKVQSFFGVSYKVKCSAPSEVIHPPNNVIIREEELSNFDLKQHKRVPSNTSSSSQSSCDTDRSPEVRDEDVLCLVTNKFWYYIFVLGTALGDEIFYATFIPFWFWNIDGAVGRRVILVWTISMYIGQGFKDIIRWPRPGYPVKKLQTKWAVEYGMPSTHAMVGVSIPFSVLFYTMDRYQYPIPWGFAIAVSWCTLICVSRIYLGMHSVLDIAAGLLLASGLLAVLIPIVDVFDGYMLTNKYSPLLVLSVSILVIVFHPNADKWTPTRFLMIYLSNIIIYSIKIRYLNRAWYEIFTGEYWVKEMRGFGFNDLMQLVLLLAYTAWTCERYYAKYIRGDTTMIVSVCAGVLLGSWTNYQLGNMVPSHLDPPYEIIWPSKEMLGCTILRTILGFCGVLATRAIAKSLSYGFVCALLGKDKNELRNSEDSLDNVNKIIVELSYKYFTYGMIGFNTTYVFPNVFDLLRINRPTYYTEI